MKRFFTHSGILLSALLFFGLSFGVAYAQSASGGFLNMIGNALWNPMTFGVSFVLDVINAALATILSIAGTLLDTTIKLSLDTSWYTNSVTHPTKSGVLEVITLGWGIIRDFFNLTFIFILLYNGIRIILDLDQSPQAKKIAIDVLIAALLINFSLFFTQLVMDGSNMLAVGLYNSIQTVVGKAGAGSISEAINVTFANQAMFNLTANSFDGYNAIINALLRICFVGISIYVFISVSFLFIGRFVAFLLLMITSPIWIAGALIPRLKPYQEKFQSTLFDQAMLAPMFLFFLYIILQVITSDIFTALSQSGINIPGGGGNKTGQVVVFAILAALLLVAKSEATKLSGEIGKTVNDAIGKGLGLAAGGVGMVGRSFAASKLGQSAIGAMENKAKSAVGTAATKINSVTSRIPLAGGVMNIDVAKNQAAVGKAAKSMREGSYDARRATLPGGAGDILAAVTGGKAKNLGTFFKSTGADPGEAKSPAEIEREKRKEAEEKAKDEAKKKLDDISAATTVSEKQAAVANISSKMIDGIKVDQYFDDPTTHGSTGYTANSPVRDAMYKKFSGGHVDAILKSSNGDISDRFFKNLIKDFNISLAAIHPPTWPIGGGAIDGMESLAGWLQTIHSNSRLSAWARSGAGKGALTAYGMAP